MNSSSSSPNPSPANSTTNLNSVIYPNTNRRIVIPSSRRPKDNQPSHPNPPAPLRLLHQNHHNQLGIMKEQLINNENSNQEFCFNMDSDSNDDYRDFHDLIVARRNSFKNIRNINYTNSPLLKLPTEVLLQIFHHLERKDLYSLLTVCREFADLIIEILWFRPNMQNDGSFKKIKSIMELPQSSTHWDYRSFIKRLNLSFMTKLVDDDLLSLFIGCPKLERLTLVNCTKLTHIPITSTLQNCEKLQSIDLTGVQDIHDDIIYALAKNCSRLQGLYAPGCGSVSEDAILTLLTSCKMLKRVKFNNSENITDNIILAMYENCKSLVEIDLHDCPNVTDKYLRNIFLDLAQLREFRISKAPKITDRLFELIPGDHYLEKLRIIDITECNAITDKLVEKLVRCAPRLRNVVLSKCMQITDASLRALAHLGRSLHYVHLGHCGLITDFGVQSLVRSCHRIQYIDLASCSQLTDWTLIELATLQKLRRIGLVKCNLITDGGILELVRRRGEQDCLERVHLSYCTNLTIGPIFLLLKNCPKLTHLSLTGISAFLRREITQYCRDPPPDFNETQKSSFCVFSGQGVNQLRNHLNQIMEDRAYLIEHGDFNSILENRRRSVNGRPINEIPILNPGPITTTFNGIRNANVNTENNNDHTAPLNLRPIAQIGNDNNTNDNDNNDMEVGDTTANNINNTNQTPNNNDMTNWAAQRGLGGLNNVGDATVDDPQMLAIDREIFHELDEGHMTPNEMRDHFQNILRNYYRQRTMERRVQTGTEEPSRGEQERRQVRPTNQYVNAPQIIQPAVFPSGNEERVNGEEDIEMEPVDLFPRMNNTN